MRNGFTMLIAQAIDELPVSPWWFVAVTLLIMFIMAVTIVVFVYGKLWFQAYMSGADVTIVSLVGMGFRQVNSRVIVTAKIMAAQSG